MCQTALVSQSACFCFGFLLTASEWLKFGATDGPFSWCATEPGVLVTLSCLDIGICLDCSQGHTGQVSQVGTSEHSLTPNSEIPAEQLGRQEAPFCALARFSTQNFLLCLLGQSVLPVCLWQWQWLPLYSRLFICCHLLWMLEADFLSVWTWFYIFSCRFCE